MMTIYIWFFVILIVTNGFTLLFLIGLINLICYIHDMIKVDMTFRKYKKKNINVKNK